MKCPQCQAEWEITPISTKPEITIIVRGPTGSRKSTLIAAMKYHLKNAFEFYGEERHIRGDVPAELIRARARR